MSKGNIAHIIYVHRKWNTLPNCKLLAQRVSLDNTCLGFQPLQCAGTDF